MYHSSEGDAIGTVLTILSVRNLPDGRMLVKTIGGKRFRIKKLYKTDGYYSANIEYFKDQPLDVAKIDGLSFFHNNYLYFMNIFI